MKAQQEELIPTRASLLNRLKDWQDQMSWKEFFNIYWKLIYGVARKAGLTDTEAQDVVQETMISVAKHIPAFKYDPAIGSFKSWLLIKTRWCIIAQFRRRALHPTAEPHPNQTSTAFDPAENIVDPAGNTLDALWEAEWQQNLLHAALEKVKRRIDPQKYQIFDYYVNKEWPPQKVAETFGVSVDLVFLTKHRVTEAIKNEVARLEKEMT